MKATVAFECHCGYRLLKTISYLLTHLLKDFASISSFICFRSKPLQALRCSLKEKTEEDVKPAKDCWRKKREYKTFLLRVHLKQAESKPWILVDKNFSCNGYCPSFREQLRIVVLHTGNIITPANLVLNCLPEEILLNAVYTSPCLLRNLCRELDLSIGKAEFSMLLETCQLISEFDLSTLDGFIEEANDVARRESRRKKYLQRIFVSSYSGLT